MSRRQAVNLLRAPLHELRLVGVALQFLTRVPVPAAMGFQPAWLQQCVRHFPLVGMLVGAAGACVLWLAAGLWPLPVAVLLSMATTLWLTGGFHEDGWADTLDALGGVVDRERALAIMKDSRIGAYGAMGLTMMLLLKAAALWSLASHGLAAVAVALAWTHAVSRAGPVLLMGMLPYAGDAEHAKAKPLATQVAWTSVGLAWLWVALLGVALLWLSPQVSGGGSPGHGMARGLGWALLAMIGVTFGCARWFARRLGGYTGDTLGAAQQCTELAGLLGLLAVWAPVPS